MSSEPTSREAELQQIAEEALGIAETLDAAHHNDRGVGDWVIAPDIAALRRRLVKSRDGER